MQLAVRARQTLNGGALLVFLASFPGPAAWAIEGLA